MIALGSDKVKSSGCTRVEESRVFEYEYLSENKSQRTEILTIIIYRRKALLEFELLWTFPPYPYSPESSCME